jgi:FdhD protein
MASLKPAPFACPADLSAGHATVTIWRQTPGSDVLLAQQDELANEVPIALEYNGIAHVTLLATPNDLEDFAYGFSFTEGLIRSATDIYDVEIQQTAHGIIVAVTIANACLNSLKRRRRAMAGRTGCGLCGIENLAEVVRPLNPVTPRTERLKNAAILLAGQQLRAAQPIHGVTGATHAAAWSDATGHLQAVREDVGRHNALDKLIGSLIRKPFDAQSGFAIISSRASFEMVQKSAAAGINALIAVSAPTLYAARMAQNLNLFLAGFLRGESFTVYAHPEYLSKEIAS